MGIVRLLARLLALLVGLLAMVPLHGAWRAVRAPSPFPRLFLRLVARVIGARVRVVGAPLRRDVFFIANHQSWTDIPILAGATGTAFIAKAELAGAPLVGWLAGLNRTVFVARAERSQVRAQVDEIAAALAGGWPLTLFPEGTTGDGIALLPFKPALLQVVSPPPPGVAVQPVLIDYGPARAEIAWAGEETGAHHARRVLSRRGGFAVTLTFLAPFVPAGNRKATAADLRERMTASLAPPPPAAADLANRAPVWEALSDLFLDTDVALLRDHGAPGCWRPRPIRWSRSSGSWWRR